MIPQATLRIETHLTNPPRPIGVGVFVDRKMIAVVSLDELRKAMERLTELTTK